MRPSDIVRNNVVLGAATALWVGFAAVALPAAEAQAQSSKSITVVVKDEPTDVDGCNAGQSTVGVIVLRNIDETLTRRDPDTGEIKPLLATSWERTDDHTWRFHLREGVTFHDGTPFTAETAANAIVRSMSEAISPPCNTRVKTFGGIVLEPKAVDAHTLDLRSSLSDPILPNRMTVFAMIAPGAPDKGAPMRTNIGTGPYVFDHWSAGQEIVFKRNEKYWGTKPAVETARFVWRTESSVRAAMVKLGEADIATVIAAQDANDKSMDYSYLNSETSFMRMDAGEPPLDDVRVRLAVNYAIDRDALRGSILSKDVIPATQTVMPSIPGHNFELDKNPRKYDPAKAKQLIAEAKAAGVPVDKEIRIIGRTEMWPNSQESVEAIAAMLRAAGLNVKISMQDAKNWLAYAVKPFPENRGPIILQGSHDNNNGDPVFSVEARYACKGSQGVLCDPKLDEKITEAATLVGDARVKAYQEIFRIVYEEKVIEAFLFHMVGYSRVNPRINFKPDTSLNSELSLASITFK